MLTAGSLVLVVASRELARLEHNRLDGWFDATVEHGSRVVLYYAEFVPVYDGMWVVVGPSEYRLRVTEYAVVWACGPDSMRIHLGRRPAPVAYTSIGEAGVLLDEVLVSETTTVRYVQFGSMIAAEVEN